MFLYKVEGSGGGAIPAAVVLTNPLFLSEKEEPTSQLGL